MFIIQKREKDLVIRTKVQILIEKSWFIANKTDNILNFVPINLEKKQFAYMIRLEKIQIKGFKDSERVINFEFSKEPITVVYGENGCGKTTFLKILHAVLSQNANILVEENVRDIDLEYSENGDLKKLLVRRHKEDANQYFFTDDIIVIENTRSLFLGTYRGIFQSQSYVRESLNQTQGLADLQNALIPFATNYLQTISRDNPTINDIVDGLKKAVATSFFTDALFEIKNNNPQHIFLDGVPMSTIEKTLRSEGLDNHFKTSNFLDIALLETVNNIMEIDNISASELIISEEDYAILEKNKSLLLETFDDDPEASFKLNKELILFLRTDDKNIIEKNKFLRLFVRNIIKNIIKPKPKTPFELVVKMFNEYLGQSKKLVVEVDDDYNVNIYIKLLKPNQTHELSKLSTGERNLLTILVCIYLVAEQPNFVFLDEPEDALNTKWQATFLAKISADNPNTQIIVASHSPAIAQKNPNCLRKFN